MRPPRLVLLICHANTCRSVIASALLRRELAREGLLTQWEVKAGGVAPYARDGALVSMDARLVLREEGIELPRDAASTDLKRHRDLVARADVILAMTKAQLVILREHFPEARGKPAYTWNEFAGADGDIEDPYGRDIEAYTQCRDRIKAHLPAVVRRLAIISTQEAACPGEA